MPYIGRGPAKSGAFRIIDDISGSFNGVLTSFALTVGNTALTVGLPETLLIAVDGVIQEAGTAYTISGSNIVFSAAPQAAATFWGVELGDVGGIAQQAVTQSAGDNSTSIATTAYVDAQVATEDTIAEMGDVTLSSIGSGEVLKWNGSAWINNTLAELGVLPVANPTFTGTLTVGSATVTEAQLEILDGATVTTAELNLLDGVSGLVQADLTKLAAVNSTATELNLLDALDRGSILYGNASGVTTVLGQGGANTVLTSDGTDIAWQAAGANTALSNLASVAINTNIFTANNTGIVIGHTAQVQAWDTYELQALGTGSPDSGIIIGNWNTSTGMPPVLNFVKSLHASIGSTAIVSDNTLLGGIYWTPDDGADIRNLAAKFFAEVDDGSPEATGVGTAFVWSQQPGGGTGALRETMRIEANGTLLLERANDVANAWDDGYSQIKLRNTATTANVQNVARIQISVNAASTGDPYIFMETIGGNNWAMGIDNSEADRWVLSKDWQLGTSNDYLRVATTGDVTVKENNTYPSVNKGIAKAWIKNDGDVGGGSSSGQDTYNITVTENGTGDRLYTFGDDFENNVYVAVGSAYGPAGDDLKAPIFGQNTRAVGSIDCLIRSSGGGNVDVPNSAAFFGEAT